NTTHRQAEITRIFGFAQRLPRGVSRGAEDFGEVARIAEFLPGLHVQERGGSSGKKRGMGRGRDLSNATEHFDVGRRMIEIVITDQTAVRLAAGHAEFLFIEFLEERALVPGS